MGSVPSSDGKRCLLAFSTSFKNVLGVIQERAPLSALSDRIGAWVIRDNL